MTIRERGRPRLHESPRDPMTRRINYGRGLTIASQVGQAGTRALQFCLTALILLAIGCGGPNLVRTNIPSPAAASPSPAPELEMSGAYTVTGSSENQARPYEGILNITNQQDVYVFKWQTTRPKPGGVGVQMGDALAVTYADAGSGKGCGVALYKIASDGSLDGKIARWGEYNFGTEKATRIEGDKFEGKYQVAGVAADGKTYQGTVQIEKNGGGYQFTWRTGNDFVGFGIWRGDRAAISFGGRQCFFALYKIMSARSLEGHWGGQRDVTFGAETAKRQ